MRKGIYLLAIKIYSVLESQFSKCMLVIFFSFPMFHVLQSMETIITIERHGELGVFGGWQLDLARALTDCYFFSANARIPSFKCVHRHWSDPWLGWLRRVQILEKAICHSLHFRTSPTQLQFTSEGHHHDKLLPEGLKTYKALMSLWFQTILHDT